MRGGPGRKESACGWLQVRETVEWERPLKDHVVRVRDRARLPDALSPPTLRVYSVAGYHRTCPQHSVPAPPTPILLFFPYFYKMMRI